MGSTSSSSSSGTSCRIFRSTVSPNCKARRPSPAATRDFAAYFEACGTCNTSTRISNAQNVLTTYAADVPPPSCVTDSGDTGQCIDVGACAALPGYMSTPGLLQRGEQHRVLYCATAAGRRRIRFQSRRRQCSRRWRCRRANRYDLVDWRRGKLSEEQSGGCSVGADSRPEGGALFAVMLLADRARSSSRCLAVSIERRIVERGQRSKRWRHHFVASRWAASRSRISASKTSLFGGPGFTASSFDFTRLSAFTSPKTHAATMRKSNTL